VLLGADPPVALTQRAKRVLAKVRDEDMHTVHPGGTVITRTGEDVRWWTWAGYRANATLAAILSELTDSVQRFDDASIRMRADLIHEMWKAELLTLLNGSACPRWTTGHSSVSSSVRRSQNAWRPLPSPPGLRTSILPHGYSPNRLASPSSTSPERQAGAVFCREAVKLRRRLMSIDH
jgi:hypothetical protein